MSRRLVVPLTLGVALVAGVDCLRAWAAGETNAQLLKNPGFEMGTWAPRGTGAALPRHWHRNWGHRGSVALVEGARLARSGTKCVRVTDASLNQGRFKIEPGMRYRVRVWLKGEGAARQAILFYKYMSTTVGGSERTKYLGTCGFGGGNRRVPSRWTMVESVFTAPTDGSANTATVAVQVSALKKGRKASALVDDMTLRAWDGRPLAIRVAACAVFLDRPGYAQALAKHPEVRKRRGPALAAVYKRAEALRKATRAGTAPLEKREALEAELEALLAEYAKVQTEVELDLEDL